jgi:hypothetical protein
VEGHSILHCLFLALFHFNPWQRVDDVLRGEEMTRSHGRGGGKTLFPINGWHSWNHAFCPEPRHVLQDRAKRCAEFQKYFPPALADIHNQRPNAQTPPTTSTAPACLHSATLLGMGGHKRPYYAPR